MKRSPIPVRGVTVFDPGSPTSPFVQDAAGLLLVEHLPDVLAYTLDLAAAPRGLVPGRCYSAHARTDDGEELHLAGLICLTSGRDPIFSCVRPRVKELAREAG